MIIETIELSTARIQLEEVSTSDGMKQQTLRLIHENGQKLTSIYRFPQDGFGFQVSHPLHHWSREALGWLGAWYPELIKEYLTQVPAKTFCFRVSLSGVANVQPDVNESELEQRLRETMMAEDQEIQGILVERSQPPRVWVLLGDAKSLPDSLEARYGDVEGFLSLLAQLMKEVDLEPRYRTFPTDLEDLIRSVYSLSFKEWLPLDYTKSLYEEEDALDFLIGLVNGKLLEWLMDYYCTRPF